jgi:hypothetical protein
VDFLSSRFDPKNFAGVTGLLDRMGPAMSFQPQQTPAAFGLGGPMQPQPQLPPPQGDVMNANAMLPESATPTAGVAPAGLMPQQAGSSDSPLGFLGGVRDKINDTSNMLLGLAAGIAGGKNWGDGLSKGMTLAMTGGQLDTRQGSRNLTEQALIRRGLDPSMARAVASNPSLMSSVAGTLFKPQVRAMTSQEKVDAGLPQNAPWFTGADGKPFLPDGLATIALKHQVVGKDRFGNDIYGEYDPTKPAGARVTADQPISTGAAAADSAIPPPPPGVDPNVWRKAQTERAASNALPADPKITSQLRQEIQGLPSYKNFAQAAPVYRSMVDAAGRDNRASDVHMIYGMAKIMDPGSVVRESEMSVAQAIATIPQRLQAEVKSQIEATGRLSPEVRQALMEEARSRVDSYKTSFDQDAGMYRGIVDRNRMDARDVIPDFGDLPAWQAPAPTQTPTKPKAGNYIWQPGQGMVPVK